MIRLYAVRDAGPVALQLPAGPAHEDPYAGLDLGVYESLRTYARVNFLDLDGHLQRLRRSIARLGWEYRLDERRLRRCLHLACAGAPFAEMRVRIDVLASAPDRLGCDARELIALSPFTLPPARIYREGVEVITTDAVARADPGAKTAEFVVRRQRIERETPGAYERLIEDASGGLPEGFSSNFYVVLDGALVTAGAGVLEGITRRIVLELARERGVPVRLQTPRIDDLECVQEAAISSSSRGLVPVVRINGRAVGDATPGSVITGLSAAYEAYVQAAVKPAV